MTRNRRRLLKAITAGGGLFSLSQVPNNWTTPVVERVLLPTHAQTTSPARDPDEPETIAGTIRISAFVDGLSDLYLQGNTARWQHREYEAPGLTTINGVDWTPIFPGSPPHNFCNCSSDTFTAVSPALPTSDMTLNLSVISVRSGASVQIVQQPTFANSYEAIVSFDDTSPGGADTLVVELVFATV